MNEQKSSFWGVKTFADKQIVDNRGITFPFLDYNSKWPEINGGGFKVKRILISSNREYVIRGIHLAPFAMNQWKLVSCIKGTIKDYVIDFRPLSTSFGVTDNYLLSAQLSNSILIPPGIGHAFQALEEDSMVIYAINNEYVKSEEKAINPLDPEIKIDWHRDFIISERDASAPLLKETSSKTIDGFRLNWDTNT